MSGSSLLRALWVVFPVFALACGGSASPEYGATSEETEGGGEAAGDGAESMDVETDTGGDDGAGGEAGGGAMVSWQGEIDDLSQLLAGSDQELDTALAESNCSNASDLRDRICQLAERICAISEEHPEHAPTRTRCEDAYERCEAAGNRYGSVCEE